MEIVSLSSSSFQMEVVCAKAAAHQGLNSLKRFTNLLSGFNVINFELNGFDASIILIQLPSSVNPISTMRGRLCTSHYF